MFLAILGKDVFPVYAGVILRIYVRAKRLLSVPRVCGGDPDDKEKNEVLCRVFPVYAGVIL